MRIVILAVFAVKIAECITVHSIDRQHDHHREIGDKQQQVKPVPVVKAPESLVGVLHLQVVPQSGLRGEGKVHRRALRQLAERAVQATYAVSKGGKQGEASTEESKSIVSDRQKVPELRASPPL